MIKVKFFYTNDYNIPKMEEEINKWIEEHPDIEISEFKQTACGTSYSSRIQFTIIYIEPEDEE